MNDTDYNEIVFAYIVIHFAGLTLHVIFTHRILPEDLVAVSENYRNTVYLNVQVCLMQDFITQG